MDKQKQIEEMAYVIYKYGQCYDDCVDGAEHNIAKHLINAGYRKIPENAMVLTRDELDKYLGSEISTLVVRIVYLEKQLAKSRNETAEKFAERAKESAEIKALAIVMGGKLYPIYKAIANKIDEICKEMTEGKKNETKQ